MKSFIIKSILTISLLSTITIQGEALTMSPSNVIIEGNANGLVSFPEDKFLEYLNMIPGDIETGVVKIENNYDSSFDLYLKAQRVSEKEEYDLLEKIDLSVTYKDEVIYKGPVSGENGMEENIYLGKFNPGDTENIYVQIELDGPTTTNEYKNKVAQVDWIFTANTDKPTTDGEDDNNTNTGTTTKPSSPQTFDIGIVKYIAIGIGTIGAFILNNKNKRKK